MTKKNDKVGGGFNSLITLVSKIRRAIKHGFNYVINKKQTFKIDIFLQIIT